MKGHCGWERLLRTWEKQISLIIMKNKRKNQETKSLSAPPWSKEVEEIILNTIFKHCSLSLLMTWIMDRLHYQNISNYVKLEGVVGTSNIWVAFKYLQGWSYHNLSEQCVSLFCYPHRKKRIIAVSQGLILQAVVLWLCCYLQRPPQAEEMAGRNLMNSTRGRTQFCSQEELTPYIRWTGGRLEISLTKKALWILLDTKSNINCQVCHSREETQQPPELP